MHSRCCKKICQAFTLIELLIVVAIIAILAAIAVPNFLEAQTRSKVARTRADQRSVAVAMEAYAVDERMYPHGTIPGYNNTNTWGFIPDCLTTPIAYLSSIPDDIFTIEYAKQMGVPRSGTPYTRFRVYCARRWPAFAIASYGEAAWTNDYTIVARALHIPECTPFIITSLGPDLKETILPWYDPTAAIYDPTNGTISNGDVTFLGGGGVR